MRGGMTTIPTMTIVLGFFAVVVLIATRLRTHAYPQLAVSVVLYSTWASALVMVGVEIRARWGLRFGVRLLASALALAAIGNALCAMGQFYFPGFLSVDYVFPMIGGRATGNLAQANQFANLLAVGLCSLVYLRTDRVLRSFWVTPAAFLLIWAGALSGSRIGLLCLLVAVGVTWFASRKVTSPLGTLALRSYVIILFGTMVLQLTLPYLHDWASLDVPKFTAIGRMGLTGEGADTIAQRIYLWSEAMRMFMSAPFFGVGVGNFAFDLYMNGQPIGDLGVLPYERNSHNLVMQLLAETGMLGAAIVVGGLALWGRNWIRSNGGQPDAAWIWIGAVVGIQLVHSLVEYPLWHGQFLSIAALVLGLGSVNGLRVTMPRTVRVLTSALVLIGGVTLVNHVGTYEIVRAWLYPERTVRGVNPEKLREGFLALAAHVSSPFGHYVELGRTTFFDMTDATIADDREVNFRALQFAAIPVVARQQPLLDAMAGDFAAAEEHAVRFGTMYPRLVAELTNELDRMAAENPERYSLCETIARRLERIALRESTTGMFAPSRDRSAATLRPATSSSLP